MAVTFKKIDSESNLKDTKKYIDAYLRLYNDPENLKYLSFTGVPFARNTVEAWLRDANASNTEYQTAFNENCEICAIMVIVSHPIEGFEILSIVVDTSSRCTGVGRQLIDIAIHNAKRKGFRSASIAVFADNRNMLSLAIKHDFRPYKIESRARWDGQDLVRLKKSLD